MRNPIRYIYSEKAFTLVELSIVMIIISLMMGSLLSLATTKSEASKISDTMAKLDFIEKAVAAYLAEYGSIPCPADSTLAPTSANFGVATQASPSYKCSGTTGQFYGASGPLQLGTVPTKALQIPDEYAYDAWNRRFTYSMIQTCNTSNIKYLLEYSGSNSNPLYNSTSNFSSINANNGATQCCGLGNNAITIKNSAGGTIANNAVLVVMSHGHNGHGAFSHNGSSDTARICVTGTANVGNNEVSNALFSKACASATASTPPVYYQQSSNYSIASSGANYFDDIVRYKTRAQLISDAKAFNMSSNYSNYLCSIANLFLTTNGQAISSYVATTCKNPNTNNLNSTTNNGIQSNQCLSGASGVFLTIPALIYKLCL